ncbi:MAG: hypothetical protein NTY81_03460 [Candidatus Staskawiczbacteria bacterium]|nr:hypothetical protein [Candidatus Staskawiczbacteria bacterium]
MADDKNEENIVPEKRVSPPEEAGHFDWKQEKGIEKKEISPDDERVSKELRQEIEKMELDDNAKAEAEKKAQKIEFLGEKEKIEHLLQMAREKGVVFAIQVARRMNEPYLLDILHDTLAQEGFYKDFTK